MIFYPKQITTENENSITSCVYGACSHRKLQALEAQLGLNLFNRGRSGAILTPEGTLLLNQAETLISHIDMFSDAVEEVVEGDIFLSVSVFLHSC